MLSIDGSLCRFTELNSRFEHYSDKWIPLTKGQVTRKMFPIDDVMEVFLFVPIYFATLGSGILLSRNGSVDGLCIALGKGQVIWCTIYSSARRC